MFIRLQVKYSVVWIIIFLRITGEIEVTKCEFCGKDFVSLGHHSWRCPAKATTVSIVESIHTVAPEVSLAQSLDVNKAVALTPACTASDNSILCVCGKVCKGRRGLMALRRSCKTAKAVGDCDDVTDATVCERVLQSVKESSSPSQSLESNVTSSLCDTNTTFGITTPETNASRPIATVSHDSSPTITSSQFNITSTCPATVIRPVLPGIKLSRRKDKR